MFYRPVWKSNPLPARLAEFSRICNRNYISKHIFDLNNSPASHLHVCMFQQAWLWFHNFLWAPLGKTEWGAHYPASNKHNRPRLVPPVTQNHLIYRVSHRLAAEKRRGSLGREWGLWAVMQSLCFTGIPRRGVGKNLPHCGSNIGRNSIFG